MDPAALQQFEQVVLALMSPDNTVRGQAEETFNQAKQNPDALTTALVTHLRKNGGEQARIRALSPSVHSAPPSRCVSTERLELGVALSTHVCARCTSLHTSCTPLHTSAHLCGCASL